MKTKKKVKAPTDSKLLTDKAEIKKITKVVKNLNKEESVLKESLFLLNLFFGKNYLEK